VIADADALIDYLGDDPRQEPRDERGRGQRRAADRVDRLLSARALATTSVAAFEVWAGGEDPETIALFAAMPGKPAASFASSRTRASGSAPWTASSRRWRCAGGFPC
jgi:hypothetical protein